MPGPTLIIHGGAGAREGSHVGFPRYQRSLHAIREEAWAVLLEQGARPAVLAAVRLLEDDPIFNAGLGSRLQRDGMARMSAALMDADQGIFAGVINIERVRHPIDVADALSSERHPVIAGSHATRLARDLGMEDFDPVTGHRMEEYRNQLAGDRGTVGAVALDDKGRLCAGTSTGGVGFEIPGRVSDSATVAGTYATRAAGVSCTGIGEDIVNHGAAVRIVTRVEDGAGLGQAVTRTIAEADRMGMEYGLIAVDGAGNPVAASARDVVTLYALRHGGEDEDFLSA
ncbi:MAG: isoaspartyl peptidase/L-asparaginase [Gammaproteobacteria bacterium]|jgi:L-asparaginase